MIEVNEAFAAVVVASARDLSVPEDLLNPNGGAIALGHPLGMSGARLALTLTYELRRRGRGQVGAAAAVRWRRSRRRRHPAVVELSSRRTVTPMSPRNGSAR